MNWDLTYLFETEEDYQKHFELLPSYVDKLGTYKGKLSDEKSFVEYFMISRDFEEAFSRVYQYVALRSDLNKKDIKSAGELDKVMMIIYRAQEVTSFQGPEIIALGYNKAMKYVSNEEISEYKFIIQKIFDQNEHVLDNRSEQLLSMFGPLTSACGDMYSNLAVGDSKPGEAILEDGTKVQVTQGNWRALIEKSKSENDRKAVFEALYKYYDDHKTTFAGIYKIGLDSDKASAKARNYKSSLEAHLDANKIPTSVYTNLVEVASTYNESLKKYNELRREYLGLSEYHTYDRFLSLATSNKHYEYEEAREMFFASIKNFPEDFQAKAHEALADGFVDVFEKDGKRSGAYSSGMVNLHPYILLNHDYTLDACFTVAHEAGHSIHTMYAEEAQPGVLQDYTIFVAEIASTFNEHNLLDYILNSGNATKEEKIMCIEKAINNICSTFYRQTLFADFELQAHTLSEQDAPINYEVLSNIMIDLYQKYYGIDINKEVYKKFVWAYIPHMFYTPFYVYQYATSFAASFKIYKDVKDGVPGAFDRYTNLLKAGGSAYPMEETLEAGVDFTKKETFMAVVERMDYLVKELEKLLK